MSSQSTPEGGWITLTLEHPLAPDAAVRVPLGAFAFSVVDLDDTLHAFEDACMKCGASLHDGERTHARIRCACGWTYDVVTGAVDGLPALRLDRLEVKRVADAIAVRVGKRR